jgi:cell division septation protein DedD
VPETKSTVPVSPPEEKGVETKQEAPPEPPRVEVGDKEGGKAPQEEAKAQPPAHGAEVVPRNMEAKKAPQAKEKPKVDSTPVRSSSEVTYPFSLFLGSVPHLDQAEQGVSKYRNSGLPVYYTEVVLSKGIWYRLYAGIFESEAQAEAYKKEKGLEGAEVKETPFANLVGVFSSQANLEGKIQSLKGLGFSPYVIKEADGKQRLLVGAFYSEDRARRQYDELKSKGIENQIVER